jgi:hypothetical protein
MSNDAVLNNDRKMTSIFDPVRQLVHQAVYHVWDRHFFSRHAVLQFHRPRCLDLVKMPFGLDLPMGATHGAGTVVMAGSIS